MRDQNKLPYNDAPMNVVCTDLNAVVDRSVRLVRYQLEITAIEPHFELAEGLPRIQCDPSQIEQVVLALVMNAVDAMPRGANLWLSTRLREEAMEAVIQLRDDGPGIAPEILPRIFEPFLTTKESARSVGLGVAVSQNIVERHHGHIDVQSVPGKGTAFTVALPATAQSVSLIGATAEGK